MNPKSEVDKLLGSLEQQRDELQVQIHLAKAEARDEWARTEDRLGELRRKAEELRGEAADASVDVLAAARLLGEEIAHTYARLRKHL